MEHYLAADTLLLVAGGIGVSLEQIMLRIKAYSHQNVDMLPPFGDRGGSI